MRKLIVITLLLASFAAQAKTVKIKTLKSTGNYKGVSARQIYATGRVKSESHHRRVHLFGQGR
jgi:hypothetical protein